MKSEVTHSNHYKHTEDYFDKVAVEKKGFYDSKNPNKLGQSIWQKRVRKLANSVFEKVAESTKKAVDIGCGNGDYTIELATSYLNISFIGIDFSKKAIDLANNDSENINNVSFRKGTVLDTKFNDAEFDTTFCINTLHHIYPNDLKNALTELARITKTNLILEIKNKNNPYNKYLHSTKVPTYQTTLNFVLSCLPDFELIIKKPIFYLDCASPILVIHMKKVQK